MGKNKILLIVLITCMFLGFNGCNDCNCGESKNCKDSVSLDKELEKEFKDTSKLGKLRDEFFRSLELCHDDCSNASTSYCIGNDPTDLKNKILIGVIEIDLPDLKQKLDDTSELDSYGKEIFYNLKLGIYDPAKYGLDSLKTGEFTSEELNKKLKILKENIDYSYNEINNEINKAN